MLMIKSFLAMQIWGHVIFLNIHANMMCKIRCKLGGNRMPYKLKVPEI